MIDDVNELHYKQKHLKSNCILRQQKGTQFINRVYLNLSWCKTQQRTSLADRFTLLTGRMLGNVTQVDAGRIDSCLLKSNC